MVYLIRSIGGIKMPSILEVLDSSSEEIQKASDRVYERIISDYEEGKIVNKDYSSLDDISDIYMARRIIIRLLEDRDSYRDIAEESLSSLKELVATTIKGIDKFYEGEK